MYSSTMPAAKKYELNNSVILRIMRYAAGNSKGSGGGHRPLLAVCRRWRLVLLGYLCSEYTIYFKPSNRVIEGVYPLWSATKIENDPGSVAFGYVNKVRIEVDYNDIFDGTVVHAMLYNLNDAFFFPAAKTMSILIEQTASNVPEDIANDNDSQARILVRHIHRMAPAIQNMHVQYYAYSNVYSNSTKDSLARLLTGLYYNKERSHLDIQYNDFFGCAEPYIAHNLTDIVCTLNISTCNYMLYLVQNSASSLISLKTTNVGTGKDVYMQLFISLYDKSIITYPRLEKLCFGATYEWDYNAPRPYLPNHAPFPRLKWLQLDSAYPFNDDILFRQNERTLEYLCIQPDMEILEILDRTGTFANSKIRGLKHVRVLNHPKVCGKSIQFDHIWAAAVSQLVYQMSFSAVQTINIDDKHSGEKLVYAFVQGNVKRACADLRVLNLPNSVFTLVDIIATIIAIPSLCELHCISAGVGKDFPGIPQSQLTDYMHKNYHPLSQSFKKWHICHDNTKPIKVHGQIESMVACALLLSVMCPRFTGVSVDFLDKAPFNSVIDLALTRNPHGKYNRNLARLQQF